MPFEFEINHEEDSIYIHTTQSGGVSITTSDIAVASGVILSEKEARSLAIALNMAADELKERGK